MSSKFNFVRGCTGITPDLSSFKNILSVNNICSYSESETNELKNILLNKFKTNRNIVIDNGSSEIIQKLVSMLNNFIIQEKDFFLYELLLRSKRKEFVQLDNNNFLQQVQKENFPQFDFRFDAVALFSLVNNITGDNFETKEIIKIAREKKNTLFIVDGAYRELTDISDEEIALLLQEDNIAYMGTFSKGYGLAGIRIGYLIGLHQEIVLIPYAVSSLSAAIAKHQLSTDFVEKHKEFIKKEQEIFLNYFPFLEQNNHKLLFNGVKAKKLFEYLSQKKIQLTLINDEKLSFSIDTKENNILLREEISNFINNHAHIVN